MHFQWPFAPPSLFFPCVHGNNLFDCNPSLSLFFFLSSNQTSILFYKKTRCKTWRSKNTIGIILPDTIILVVLVAYLYVSVLNARLIACNRLHTPRMEKFSSLRSENTRTRDLSVSFDIDVNPLR